MPFSFLHPLLFALGAACVAIPIVIHLLKRRRRVIPWGAMRFLEEAYRKRRRIITLEQLVLLTLRCLLVLLIALGVGSIVMGRAGTQRLPKTLVIVLDDSIASARSVDDAPVLRRHARGALQRLDALDPSMGDRAVLISASAPARGVVLPASDDLGEVRALIESASPSDAGLDLRGVLDLIAQIDTEPDRPTRTEVHFASDARALERGVALVGEDPARVDADELTLPEPDTSAATNVGVALAQPTRALVVRDALPLPEALRVELVRSGAVDATTQTALRVLDDTGVERGRAQIEWRVGERERALNIAIDTRAIEPTAATSVLLRVELSEDDNPRDNRALVALATRGSLRVAVLDRPRGATPSAQREITPSRWVRAALAPRSGLGVQISSVDASQAEARLTAAVDAVFVLAPGALSERAWERLARLRDQGVMIVVTPDAADPSLAWFDGVRTLSPATFEPLVQREQHDPPLTLGRELPETSLLAGIASEWDELAGAVTVDESLGFSGAFTPVASLSGGAPLGVQMIPRDASGVLVVLAVPFDLGWSNLTARPLFVALVQELVRQGVGEGESRPAVVAGMPLDAPDWAEGERSIDLGEGDTPDDPRRHAGAIAYRDAQGQTRAVQVVLPDALGANADTPDREALPGQLAPFIEAQRVRWIGGSGETDDAIAPGEGTRTESSRLALWMLTLALFVAVLEFLLARLFTQRLIASERAMGAEGRGARA